MSLKNNYIRLISILLFTSSLTVNANEYMSAEAVKNLVTNKTAIGQHLKKDYSYQIYFSATGELIQIKTNGDKRNGQWEIKSNGKHCVEWANTDVRKCWSVKNNGDGSYTKVKLKNDKIIPLILWRDFKEGDVLKR